MVKKSLLGLIIVAAASSSFSFANKVSVQATIPYSADSRVAQNIRSECVKLGSQLATFTQDFAKKSSTTIELVDTLDTTMKGRVLHMEITDAVSMGNAFTGHHKFSSARGTLYENGKKLASFEARRQSMGGAFGGYKGSCSVLGRTTKAMGKDIANWLQNPTDNARLGDM